MQFLSWIPMNEVLSPQFMEVLFKYIRLTSSPTSLTAFACVNEILAQNYVPKEFSDFVVSIFKQLFLLLQELTQSREGLSQLEDEYVDQFTRFTSLFVSHHLRRVEQNEAFPIIPFLSLLYQYTFMQTSLEGFLSCLEIWEAFLDYLLSQQENNQSGIIYERYADGLAALTSELTQKSQFQSNAELLSTLDAEDSTEGANDSELETYYTGCLNIIGKVALLYPDKILGILPRVIDRLQSVLQVHNLAPNSEDYANLLRDAEVLLRIFSQAASGFVCHSSLICLFMRVLMRDLYEDRALWM